MVFSRQLGFIFRWNFWFSGPIFDCTSTEHDAIWIDVAFCSSYICGATLSSNRPPPSLLPHSLSSHILPFLAFIRYGMACIRISVRQVSCYCQEGIICIKIKSVKRPLRLWRLYMKFDKKYGLLMNLTMFLKEQSDPFYKYFVHPPVLLIWQH